MNACPRTLVIINHVAANARRTWPKIETGLKAHGVRVDLHVTKCAGDATRAVRAALRDGYSLIAAVGGDGTLSEAAAGFFALDEAAERAHGFENGGERRVDDGRAIDDVPAQVNKAAVLAILPAGTGDDFARGLSGGRRVGLDWWLKKLTEYCRNPDEAQTHLIDVIYGVARAYTPEGARGLEHRFICLNVATIGLGAEVARRVGAHRGLMRSLPGEVRFVAAACAALAAWRERLVRVRLDDGEWIEYRSNLMAVANGVYAGGGMMFAPSAKVDDGAFDVLLSHDLTRASILRELPRIRRGAHLSNPNVRTSSARAVRFETAGDALAIEADGNVRGETPAAFRLLPGALRVLAP